MNMFNIIMQQMGCGKLFIYFFNCIAQLKTLDSLFVQALVVWELYWYRTSFLCFSHVLSYIDRENSKPTSSLNITGTTTTEL